MAWPPGRGRGGGKGQKGASDQRFLAGAAVPQTPDKVCRCFGL